MKMIVIAPVLLSAAATLVTTPAVRAGVAVPGPEGFFCQFGVDANAQSDDPPDEIVAGPATVEVGAGGAMICTIKVGAGFHDSTSAEEAKFRAHSTGLIVGVQAVLAPDDVEIHLCTSYEWPDGSTIYWTSDDDGGRWHTDPSKPCSATWNGSVWDIIAEEVCPELIAEHYARDPSHSGPAPTDTEYYDHEGDYFFDFAGDGIYEADAITDMVLDCPAYVFPNDQTTSDADSPTANSVIDF